MILLVAVKKKAVKKITASHHESKIKNHKNNQKLRSRQFSQFPINNQTTKH